MVQGQVTTAYCKSSREWPFFLFSFLSFSNFLLSLSTFENYQTHVILEFNSNNSEIVAENVIVRTVTVHDNMVFKDKNDSQQLTKPH